MIKERYDLFVTRRVNHLVVKQYMSTDHKKILMDKTTHFESECFQFSTENEAREFLNKNSLEISTSLINVINSKEITFYCTVTTDDATINLSRVKNQVNKDCTFNVMDAYTYMYRAYYIIEDVYVDE